MSTEKLLSEWEREAKLRRGRTVGAVHMLNSELWSIMVWYAPGAPATVSNNGFGYLWRQYRRIHREDRDRPMLQVDKRTTSPQYPDEASRADMLAFLGRVADDWKPEGK
ncbi:MAG TPA: hypothetical protein VF981_13600 [Gemmatimonadaceae bacterium]